MRLAEFKSHISARIADSVRNAEIHLGVRLPTDLAFRWLGPEGPLVTSSIEDEVARLAFEGEDAIWPCIDIGPIEIDATGRLVIGAIRAGYLPKPFGKNWKGEDGPFVLVYSDSLAPKRKELYRIPLPYVAVGFIFGDT